MPIRVLDAATVGRIAAGEVVERPSSVVKELMENAIDAGATAITVEIKGGGIEYMRVTDNGGGIEPGQVRLAFENHATSKLQNAEQLDDIRTLGFRGEALPSIASVSHVEMTTRARGQDTGVKLNIDGGADLRVRETGCPEGTTFVMKDLFYNIPVRQAFLKKPGYEGGLVGDAVARLILGNPGVAVRYINNGTNVYHSFGDGKLRHAVFAVYGKQTAEQMVDVDASEGGVRVYGLIGVGELAKSTRAHQAFFINGRAVRCAMLSKALEEVCRSRVTIGMYPMCALNLVIPPASVNVNVHPNKLEVRFKDEITMRTACERLLATAFEGERVLQLGPDRPVAKPIERVATVREIVPPPIGNDAAVDEKHAERQNAAQSAEIQPSQPGSADDAASQTSTSTVPSAGSTSKPQPKREKPVQLDVFQRVMREELDKLGATSGGVLREDRLSDLQAHVQAAGSAEVPAPAVEVPLSAQKQTEVSNNAVQEEKQTPVLNSAVQENPTTVGSSFDKPVYRVIGVVLKTYILIEADDSLVLIDQHAAHERLNYEKFMAQLEVGRGSQQLLTPMVLRLSAREMALIQENLDVLRDSGYEVEPFGEQDIQVRAVPFILGRAELKPAFMDTINALNRLKNATVDLRRAEVAQMACKAAIKGGDPLSEFEIESLIRQLLETGAPPTCPHGRPVMKIISRRELEKMFKRIQ
ncbi:MAG: DNA mismatch repair endonuclease MutL [Clostridia bacterium]|nr:DNA mismatch repair endonuclease MutL [Clostridia bacterium]